MSLTIFDLLFWGLIIWYGWKTIQKMRKGPAGPFMTGEDGRPLTDTQIHYRQQQAIMKADKINEGSDEFLNALDQFTAEQQHIIEASLYIQNNMRSFHWYSWLMTPVDSRLVFRYICNMSLMIGSLVVFPLYMGWPILTPMLVGFIVAMDLLTDRQQRILEVTKWDPEFQRRFVIKH